MLFATPTGKNFRVSINSALVLAMSVGHYLTIELLPVMS